jgi:ADP-heptose:LPS heptosyltransferase
MDKILLVSLDNLGDIVFASALAAPMKRRFPDAELSVWCKAYAADAARLIPEAARVFAADPFWDVSPGTSKGSLRAFARILLEIRRERFSLAVLCSDSTKAAAALRAAGIPMRVGFGRRFGRLFLTHPVPAADASKPVLQELSRLLGPLGIGPTPLVCRLDAEPLAERRAKLAAVVGDGRLAVIHPFAGDTARCAPLSEWGRFAQGLRSKGFSPLWIGTGPELKSLRERLGAPKGHWWLDRQGDGILADAAAAISLAEVFAGHDSGPLHLAAAFGVPCLAVFSPGEPRRTFPQGQGPWRLLSRPAPQDVSAGEMLRELESLLESVRA